MSEFLDAFAEAWALLARRDAELFGIVALSLRVSVTAVLIAAVVGLPFGALLALRRFPGRGALVVLIDALMGLPPVVVGLVVYLALSRDGPFAVLGLLYSPTAMIIAQAVLVLPIVTALSRQTCASIWSEYEEQLRSLGATPGRAVRTVLWDGRFELATAVLAGFGRASAEVGAVFIVGGNIERYTRVMTTTIALETRKGDLALALGLGMILLLLALGVNLLVHAMRAGARRASAWTA